MNYLSLDTPAVLVDMDTIERNIRQMLDGAKSAGLSHRPHIKTHRCVELAKMQIIPNHACVIPNLAGEMYKMREGEIVGMLTVVARGASR